MVEQYSAPSFLSGDPLLGVLRRLTERSSEEAIADALGEAASIVGASRISLATDKHALEAGESELRVHLAGTSQHLFASFRDPPTRTAVERIQVLASSVSLVLRFAARERESERAHFHVTLGRGVAGVIHDIANPLNALQLSVESARDGIDVAEALDDSLGSLRLIRTALDRLRRFTGVLNARPSAVDVGAAISSALRIAKFATRGLAEVVVRVTPELSVWARPGEIEHVLVNLLINAAHAIGSLGGFQHRISVTGFARGSSVIIEVHDTGPGVAPEHINHLFDEGFTTKASRHGSGLGLSLCRDIVRKLGGAIDIRSPIDEGTHVTVRLPAAPAPSLTTEHDGRPRSLTEALPLARVLVVDADDLVARALVRALNRVAAVTTTASVDRALTLIDSEPFDLIVCEHNPPHLDGLVVRREQALRWPEHSGRVVLTLIDPVVDLPIGTRVMTKPLDVATLKALIDPQPSF